jgi:hypothetical protein
MDELKALRDLLASPDPPLEAVVERQREKLMTLIDTTTVPTGSTVGPRRRRAVALIAIPAVVLLAAASWAMLREDAHEAAAFSCVADGVTAVLPNDGTPPVEACRHLWEAGGMASGVTTAPPLVACVRNHAAVVVIKGNGAKACESAGMTTWSDQPAYEAVGSALRAVRSSLHDRFARTGDGCATEADWRSGLANQTAARGWTIRVDQIEKSRSCYDVGSIDPAKRTVTIVGVPGNYSIGCDPRTGC